MKGKNLGEGANHSAAMEFLFVMLGMNHSRRGAKGGNKSNITFDTHTQYNHRY